MSGMNERIRLDVLLVRRGLCPGRQAARDAVLRGDVTVDGKKADRPGRTVPGDAALEISGGAPQYVSRGARKLEKALSLWPLELTGAVCLDIGASTGGFTDCMLRHGASRVYAVDVGRDQLAGRLRSDPRVISLEGVNARYLTDNDIREKADFISVDVSFISLRLILPALRPLLKPSGRMVCLVKPQFEAGRDRVGKRGVVKDASVHRQVLEELSAFAGTCGFSIADMTFSPLRGPEGNIEFLALLAPGEAGAAGAVDIRELVDRSHREL